MSGVELYSWYRSSSAYRVRIALNVKGIEYTTRAVDLLDKGPQSLSAEIQARNSQGMVPVLLDGERVFHQSLAIIEYLDESYPEPPLLPTQARDRARVRSLSQVIACDVHPLNTLRVKDFFMAETGQGEEAWGRWVRHWIEAGLLSVEQTLSQDPTAGPFCLSDTPTVADLCLIPQLYNARQAGCDLSRLATLLEIESRCLQLPAFVDAAPENQPDAV